MNRNLEFKIENLPMDELIKEKAMYPNLRKMIRSKREGRDVEAERLDVLFTAELNTNIAIIYQIYLNDSLESRFSECVIRSRGVANFGDEIHRLKSQSKICRVLADLDVPKIGASPVLANLYHEMRVETDESKRAGRSFLHSKRFWILFFSFYHEYWGIE